MLVLNIKWETEEEKNTIKSQLLEYEVFPSEVIFINLTTHAVIRTFIRKEVINND